MHCLVRTPIERLLGVGAVVLGIATELLREVLTVPYTELLDRLDLARDTLSSMCSRSSRIAPSRHRPIT